MKVSELTGAQLDYWVAKAEEKALPLIRGGVCYVIEHVEAEIDFSPSSDWEQGGPIIEREKITLMSEHDGYCAVARHCKRTDEHNHDDCGGVWFDSSCLIAAMRAYVASKFGDEVSEV